MPIVPVWTCPIVPGVGAVLCCGVAPPVQFTLVPPQRGVAILGVCACVGGGPAVPADFLNRPGPGPAHLALCESKEGLLWRPHQACV